MKLKNQEEVKDLGKLLLEIGTLLMSNGASTARIRMTVDRIANSFGYNADMLITHRALTLALRDADHNQVYNNLKRTSPHGVNFKLVSGISRMSWRIVQQGWTIEQINEDLKRLQALPHYPRIIVLSFVSLAGASFCRLAGGNAIEMLIAFVATFVGLFARQEFLKKKFNPYIAVLVGATVSALISGSFSLIGPDFPFEHGFATSVLYLIPGIPLIHSFTDLIEGNTLNGILRWAHGLIIAFMIALGLSISIYLYHI
ncbi:MAG: threonine/serine ThrE exporter family protein [Bacteroidales bacterium]